MCGIIGFAGNDEALGTRMTEAIHHRGPDDGGVFADDTLTFGNRRLAVIDLSPRGHQPMWYGNLGVVYNGEIYNFKELRAALAGMGERFESDSDTEVILKGFAREGKDFFSRLRGMWALALYDRAKKELTLARDPFGIKPLYYLKTGEHFAFASEMKALNTFAKEKKIRFSFSKEGCASFFTLGYAIHPFTVFNEIKKLGPGEVLTYSLTNGTQSFSKTEWKDVETPQTLEETLKDSVRHHLVADVPVGIFLSGGVDSTLLALMLKELKAPLQAFTIAMEERDDAAYATKIAQFAGLSHHVVHLTEERLQATYKRLFDTLDEPVADSGILPTLVVSEEARKYVTCVLTGEGGDELFLGYERYRAMVRARSLSAVPFAARFLQAFSSRRSHLFAEGSKNDLWGMYLALVSLGWNESDAETLRKAVGNTAPDKVSLSYFDERFYLPNDLLYKTDIATMAHSLEARTPFLDSAVSAFARRIPDSEKLGGLGKKPLRALLEKRLPPELMMQTKLGFSIPRKLVSALIAPDVREAADQIKSMRVPGISESALTNVADRGLNGEIAQKLPALPFSLVVFAKVVSEYDVRHD